MKKLLFLIKTEGKIEEEIFSEVGKALVKKGIWGREMPEEIEKREYDKEL